MYEDLYYEVTPASNEHRSDAIWRNFGAQYLKEIEQYKGTPYYEQLLNNPYLSNGTEYTPTWWDQVREMFGDYSVSDNFYAGRNQQAQEHYAKIISAMTADSLNSPTAKVARDKAAGLNSDLVGVQAADSVASGVSSDDVAPAYPDNSGTKALESGMQIAQAGISFVKGIMEFGSMFMDMRGKSLSNTAQDFAVNDSAYDFVLKFLAGSDHFQTKDDGSIEVVPIDDSIYKDLQDSLVAAYGKTFKTRQAQKILKYLRGRVVHDKDGKTTLAYQNKRAELVASLLENHQKGAKIAGSKGFDDDFMTFASNIAKYFSDIDYAVYKAQKDAEEKISKYQSEKYGYSQYGQPLGEAEAEAQFEAFKKQALQDSYDKLLDEQWKSLENYLKNECRGTWYGAFGLLLLPVARKIVSTFMDVSGSGIGSAAAKAALGL